MIPHRLLDSPNGLTTAERLVLFCIYRLTIGYQRLSCKISYSKLREMSGVTAIGRVCHTLILKSEIKMDDVAGKAHIITIPEPVTSFTQSRSQPSTSVTTTPNMSSLPLEHEVVGSRGAIYNIKDNFKESTLSKVIIEEMKSKYPDKDVNSIADKVIAYYQGKSVPLNVKFREWCERERVSNKKAHVQFKLDITGFPIGFCEKCGASDFYKFDELNGDSRCCNSRILPARRTSP